jgi:hypothetical protein
MVSCWKGCVRLVSPGGLRRDPGWPDANCGIMAVRMCTRHVITWQFAFASVMVAHLDKAANQVIARLIPVQRTIRLINRQLCIMMKLIFATYPFRYS